MDEMFAIGLTTVFGLLTVGATAICVFFRPLLLRVPCALLGYAMLQWSKYWKGYVAAHPQRYFSPETASTYPWLGKACIAPAVAALVIAVLPKWSVLLRWFARPRPGVRRRT